MIKHCVRTGAAALVLLWSVGAAAEAGAKSSTVSATGQAAIYGKDKAHARDRAIDDALRKAVEQAIGTMVSSETITENFQLISDKILSKSSGYVRKYTIKSEKEDDGVYVVTVEAEVSSGDLNSDLDGILAVLRGKDMPRVLMMVSEQNVGQAGASFWWGDKTFSTNLDAVENTFIDVWGKKGIRFVDRQALQGKLSVNSALTSASPDESAIKEFAGRTGAEVVIIGKAVANDIGPIMGTQMHSLRANISVRALRLDNSSILGTATLSQAVGHIDPITGGTRALKKAASKAADELLGKMLDRWKSELTGPLTITLRLSKIPRSKNLRQFKNILREQFRGVQDVRQRLFSKKTAELEVELKGTSQDLAEALEEKQFPGFRVEIEEVTPNTVAAVVVK